MTYFLSPVLYCGTKYIYLLQAERMEKERVKQLTLDINDRLEEEDYQDQLAQVYDI